MRRIRWSFVLIAVAMVSGLSHAGAAGAMDAWDTSARAAHPGGAGNGLPPTHPSVSVAVDPVVLPTATPTITLNIGSGYAGSTPMAIGYHPSFDRYYGAMGGNPDYSGFVWDASGGLIQTHTPINVDVRSVYFNPNTSAIETVSYGAVYGYEGLYLMGLAGGFYTGSNLQALASLPGLASDQSMPAYDPGRNRLYSRSESADVYLVDRATGGFLGAVTLDLAPAGFPALLGEAIGFDADADVLITVDLTNSRALVHRLNGTFLGASSLPPFVPTQGRFNMGYAKGQLFVFDYPSNAYHGYRILAPLVQHTITATAGPHGGISPNGAVLVPDDGSQTFVITPDSLYRVADVRVDSASVGKVSSYTFANVKADHTIAVSFEPENSPPNCSRAVASEFALWPPNHKYHAISILGVTDPDGDPVTITATGVTQDEPLNTRGDGNTCPDAQISGGQVSVRAERAGAPGIPGNGRVYAIHFTAADGRGGSCDGTVTVCVPHESSDSGPACVDDGQFYSSLGPCRGGGDAGGEAVVDYGLQVSELTEAHALLEFALPGAGFVQIAVYDVAGRRLATLENSTLSAGVHQREWSFGGIANGVYFVRMQIGAVTRMKTVLKAR